MRNVDVWTLVAIGGLVAASCVTAWAQGAPRRQHGPNGGPHGPRLEQLDTNQDGSISRDEFTTGMSAMQKQHFTRMDANGNGTLSKDELAKGPGGQAPPPPPNNGTATENGRPGPPPGGRPGGPPPVEELDANSDGSVTFEEFCAAFEKHNSERFGRMDLNSDGTLSADEMAQARPPRGPRPNGTEPQR